MSSSRCGHPPTRSAPAAIASRSSARWSAPPLPVTGQPHERDDLDRRSRRRAVAHLGERLDAAQAVLERDVGVGAHRDVAVARHQPGGALGPLDDVVDRGEMAGWRPSPRWRPAGRRSGWRCARPGTPCRGGRAARRPPEQHEPAVEIDRLDAADRVSIDADGMRSCPSTTCTSVRTSVPSQSCVACRSVVGASCAKLRPLSDRPMN